MQAAFQRGRKKPTDNDFAPVLVGPPPRALSLGEELIENARQDYLDALPIAGAVICVSTTGDPYIDMANSQFSHLTSWNGYEGRWVGQIDFLRDAGIARVMEVFLHGGETVLDFEARDGHGIGSRHFSVRLARLKPNAYSAQRCLVTLIDRTAQIETEKSLRAEMLRDSLTGLPNRLAFNEQVESALGNHEAGEVRHAVVVLDVTRFSRVNECMGAIAGDELLITFARRIFSALRAGDVLARTGGDEFGILMRLDKGLDDALQLAERIRTVLATPFRLSELEIRVDCSVGISLLTDQVELAEEVLRNAQFALKRSKQSGLVQVYEPNQARVARRRFSIETELRRAIEANQLTLAYQPLISLATGEVSAFEALARWEHEGRGTISPEEFIPVAEESGLILSLGRWALDAATRTLAGWDETVGRKLPLSIAVNLSPIQVARDDVPAAVADALSASGLEGERLTLELTESTIIQDPQRATTVLEALKGLRARVAMDDFGTGYTSLAYLQRLPIDMLKIDRSFVTGMLKDRDSIAIVRAVLSLAAALGITTTAEGVECAEVERALAELGCSRGQGFHFSEPLEAQAALDYWLSRNA
ncbi:putative bifunctional diguanylate cyclase/phosphodiesterase [Allosphingosinicella humi]